MGTGAPSGQRYIFGTAGLGRDLAGSRDVRTSACVHGNKATRNPATTEIPRPKGTSPPGQTPWPPPRRTRFPPSASRPRPTSESVPSLGHDDMLGENLPTTHPTREAQSRPTSSRHGHPTHPLATSSTSRPVHKARSNNVLAWRGPSYPRSAKCCLSEGMRSPPVIRPPRTKS